MDWLKANKKNVLIAVAVVFVLVLALGNGAEMIGGADR